jgi:hypothetical protein
LSNENESRKKLNFDAISVSGGRKKQNGKTMKNRKKKTRNNKKKNKIGKKTKKYQK